MTEPTDDLIIRPFQPADQAEAKRLILAGLAEHWGALDPTRNPDLNDIAASYAGARFLVAYRGERLIGAGALLPRSAEVAEIVRMSVARAERRRGVGRAILEELIAYARAAGFRRIILETTATWQEAIAFYQRAGFRFTHHQDGDAYFALEIEKERI
jgi:GNAT superfamily N-acetyltransferase